MFANPKDPQSKCLPFWAEGRVSLFAFQALKQAKAPYGYTGKPATMRKLAAKGFVRQIEGGAYVVTEEGIDLIEGRCRCPSELDWRGAYPHYPADYAHPPFASQEQRADSSRQPSQGAAGMVHAEPDARHAYTVEPITGGCQVIRPQFGGGAGIRFRERKAP